MGILIFPSKIWAKMRALHTTKHGNSGMETGMVRPSQPQVHLGRGCHAEEPGRAGALLRRK